MPEIHRPGPARRANRRDRTSSRVIAVIGKHTKHEVTETRRNTKLRESAIYGRFSTTAHSDAQGQKAEMDTYNEQ